MLNIYVGKHKDRLEMSSDWFNLFFDRENLLTDFSKRLIKTIDHCEVFDKNVIIHEIYGGLSPEKLSSGTKSILLLMYNDVIIDDIFFGDNCIPFLVEAACTKDITICASRLIELQTEKTGHCDVRILNDDSYVDTCTEWYDKYTALGGI